MQRFSPVQPPQDAPDWFQSWARQHNDAIRKAANAENGFVSHQVLNASPAKTTAGATVYADGVNFNPGSGEGLYRRNKDNTAWVFLG